MYFGNKQEKNPSNHADTIGNMVDAPPSAIINQHYTDSIRSSNGNDATRTTFFHNQDSISTMFWYENIGHNVWLSNPTPVPEIRQFPSSSVFPLEYMDRSIYPSQNSNDARIWSSDRSQFDSNTLFEMSPFQRLSPRLESSTDFRTRVLEEQLRRHNNEFVPLPAMRSYQNIEIDGKLKSQSSPQLISSSYETGMNNATCSEDNDVNRKSIDISLVKPKRPLTAYNLFFKDERARLIDDATIPDTTYLVKTIKKSKKIDVNGSQVIKKAKPGFEEMAKIISSRWKSIDPLLKLVYEEKAKLETKRYYNEMDVYKEKKSQELSAVQHELVKTVDDETLRRYLADEGNKSGRYR